MYSCDYAALFGSIPDLRPLFMHALQTYTWCYKIVGKVNQMAELSFFGSMYIFPTAQQTKWLKSDSKFKRIWV